MTRDWTRTFAVTAAVTGLLLTWPGRAQAQRVQVDVKIPSELSRELRDALRDASISLNEALRELPKELGAIDGAWGHAQERNWRGEATDRQSKTLAIGPNGTIELHNISGDITVTAGNGSDASIQLVRRARGKTDADAKLGLDRVKVDLQVVGTRATVKADYPNDRQAAYAVAVDMIVSAPVGTRVVVNSISADVTVSGVRGELDVTTISGDISLSNVGAVSEVKTASGDVTITGATSDGTLEVGSLNGDVVLQQIKARRINASTLNGDVIARNVTCDAATITTMSGDAVFAGELARNGRYEVTTHSGDVRFVPTGQVGFTLVANAFSGEIVSSLTLQSEGSRSRSHSLTGKVGDGSATVTLQSFNGDVSLGAGKK